MRYEIASPAFGGLAMTKIGVMTENSSPVIARSPARLEVFREEFIEGRRSNPKVNHE